jgi:tripeptide aminopeptidase
MKQKILENFLRYIAIDTQSKEDAETFPSTHSQRDFAQLLVDELQELGIDNAQVDEYGYVMATIPATVTEEVPIVGLIAHLDTSPEVSGENIKAQVIEKYTGGDIVINKELNSIIKESENKELKKCVGHTLVTSDGTTLIGADDKAGVAAIMTLVQELHENPHVPHGTIRIAFTPDEEVGHGADHFDLEKFGADYAYTIDGGFTGELNKETFSANGAVISVEGRNIHPGTAKDIMVNSIRAMGEIIAQLPREMAPETTDGYDPFIHPMAMKGSVDTSSIKLILRDFKTEGLDKQKQILENIVTDVQKKYPEAKVTLDITESYRNMREELEKHPHVTENLWEAASRSETQPFWKPIRGGTDGSRLTAMGLPTPNIFTGSCNHHSTTEWLSVDALEKAVETLINVIQINCERS